MAVPGTSARRASARRPDEAPPGARAWRIGLLAGVTAGVGAAYLNRVVQRSARGGLVDWRLAEAQATARLRRDPGALDAAALREVQPAYAAAMARIVPELEATLGSPLPGVVARHAVVDRAGWAAANLETFKGLMAHLEGAFGESLTPQPGNLGQGVAALANRAIATQQIAFLVSYLGTRVLGQYDVALLSAEAPPGQLLFVEENIRAVAAAIQVPVDEFRLWVALHETTHAFEFEAHPWLRPYLAERLEGQLSGLARDLDLFRAQGLTRLVRRLRGARDGGSLLEGLLDPQQRRLLREIQVVMSLLEGFSDWAMDRVGARLLPDVELLRRRFEERRSLPRRGLDRLMARLTGMDLKLEQYGRGSRFVSRVVELAGIDALDRLWEGPATLPSEAELDDPARWVRRMQAQRGGA